MIRGKFKKKVFERAALVSHLTYQIGELSALREKSQEVKPEDINTKQIRSVIAKLKKTLNEYKRLVNKGRGVAAIQIGVPLKIAVIFKGKSFLTIINPKITKKSKTLLRYPEMCMSANPIIAKISRPSYIEFEYLDQDGNKQLWNDKDELMNRVIEHEIDHMEGIINIDLVQSKDLILLSDPGFFKNARFEKV